MLAVQALVLLGAAGLFLDRHEAGLDAQTARRALAPGRLMQAGVLSYASVADRRIIGQMVGETLVDGMVVGANGNVFHALDPDDLGRQVATVGGIDPQWFRAAAAEARLFEIEEGQRSYLISITPLLALDTVAPFLFTYIKLDTTALSARKTEMRRIVLSGVAFCCLVTTLIAYAAFELLLLRRIRSAMRFVGGIGGGDATIRKRDALSAIEAGLRAIAGEQQLQESRRLAAEIAVAEAEARAKHAGELIEAVPEGILTVDSSGRVLSANPAAARLLRRADDALVGSTLGTLLTPLADASATTSAWTEDGTGRAVVVAGDGPGTAVDVVVRRLGAGEQARRGVLLFPATAPQDGASASIGGEIAGLLSAEAKALGERLGMLADYVTELETSGRLAASALDHMPLAVAVVGGDGAVEHLNLRATQLVTIGDGLSLRDGRLVATRDADDAMLRRLLADVLRPASDPAALPWAVARVERASGKPLVLRFARLSPAAAGNRDWAVILISDPALPLEPPVELLQQLYGLSRAEAGVLRLLISGQRPGQIAAELGVSVQTVRTQLSAIYAKTGTSHQAEIVRRAIVGGAWFQEPRKPGPAVIELAGARSAARKRRSPHRAG